MNKIGIVSDMELQNFQGMKSKIESLLLNATKSLFDKILT